MQNRLDAAAGPADSALASPPPTPSEHQCGAVSGQGSLSPLGDAAHGG
jgi:hypothetical protein